MQDLISIFDVTSRHLAQHNVNWYFLVALQHENKDKREKQFGSKYFPAYCFINLLLNYLLHAAPYVIYRSRLHQILGQISLCLLRNANTVRPKNFQGYVVLLLVTTLGNFQIFVAIFAHPATPINEAYLEPLWPSGGHGANRASQLALPHGLRFCYTQKVALLKHGAIQYFFYFSSVTFQFCWIWCGKLALNGPKKAKNGTNWHKIVNFLH